LNTKIRNDKICFVDLGAGYGPRGEGYFRATLTTEESRMKEAISRMKKALGHVEF